jgi:hypothetical protein
MFAAGLHPEPQKGSDGAGVAADDVQQVVFFVRDDSLPSKMRALRDQLRVARASANLGGCIRDPDGAAVERSPKLRSDLARARQGMPDCGTRGCADWLEIRPGE